MDQLDRKFQLSRDINEWHASKDARKSVKITLKNSEKIIYVTKSMPIKLTLDLYGKL